MGGQTSKRKIYFKELSDTNNSLEKTEMKEKVMVTINISNSNPSTEYYIKSFEKKDDTEKMITETEKLKGNNNIIKFQTTFILDYYFECQQLLIFKIYTNNTENIINTSLGTIVGSRGNCYSKKINDNRNEIINISGFQTLSSNNSNGTHLLIKFYIINDDNIKGYNFKDTNNKFYYKIINKTDLYRSEDISDKGTFFSIKIPLSFLSPNFTIIFYNNKDKQLTSFNDITIEQIINMNDSSFPLIINNRKINMQINTFYKNKSTFLEYIENNLEIGLGISIDFTGSSYSLHFTNKGEKSDYEKAIEACGNILASYDSDQKFPVWGFGADNVKGYNNLCFPINFKNDPEIYSIKGVIEEYHKCLKQVSLSYPTRYSNSIKYFVKEVKKQNVNKYNILLFLTDGVNEDMSETKDIICEASKLPISIIIVGLGNDNFTNMKILDGDDNPLTNTQGEKCFRDIVQFVAFNEHRNDPNNLAKEVLAEIPQQVVEYYQSQGIEPEDL